MTYTYCWQGPLITEDQPSFIIANEADGDYQFALIHPTGEDTVRRVPIVPVGSQYTGLGTPEQTGWHYYALRPWDLRDLHAHTRLGTLYVFTYRDRLPAGRTYPSEAVGLLFNGVEWKTTGRPMLAADEDAEAGWDYRVAEIVPSHGIIARPRTRRPPISMVYPTPQSYGSRREHPAPAEWPSEGAAHAPVYTAPIRPHAPQQRHSSARRGYSLRAALRIRRRTSARRMR